MSRSLRIARESLAAIAGNRLRFFMMTAAIFIGISSLTVVICISLGTRQRVMMLVSRHGLDTLMIRPGTGKKTGAPGGDRSIVSLSLDDAHAIEASVRNVLRVAPVQNQRRVEVKYADRSSASTVFGVTPDWAEVRSFGASEGDFISAEDLVLSNRVCLLGRTVKKTLFGNNNPIGQTIRIKSVPFTVKGVLVEKGASASGTDRDDRIIIPLSTASKRLFAQTYLNQIVVQAQDVLVVHETVKDIQTMLRESTDCALLLSMISPSESQRNWRTWLQAHLRP